MRASADSFSASAPLVTFFYFIGAILFGMVFVHPAFLLVALFSAAAYYLTISGSKGLRTLTGFIPLFVFLSFLNPLLNTRGERVLLTVFGRPYTLEALCYGMAIAAMFIIVMLWFMCYHRVMTSDKFTAMFGNVIPSISLLLVMILRLVPAFVRQTERIAAARRCVGLGAGSGDRKERMQSSSMIISALASWALEGSVVTADSMRARGYGTSRRSSFQGMELSSRDRRLLFVLAVCFTVTAAAAASGSAHAEYTPVLSLAPLNRPISVLGLTGYAGFLLTPSLLNLYETLLFRRLRKKVSP